MFGFATSFPLTVLFNYIGEISFPNSESLAVTLTVTVYNLFTFVISELIRKFLKKKQPTSIGIFSLKNMQSVIYENAGLIYTGVFIGGLLTIGFILLATSDEELNRQRVESIISNSALSISSVGRRLSLAGVTALSAKLVETDPI